MKKFSKARDDYRTLLLNVFNTEGGEKINWDDVDVD